MVAPTRHLKKWLSALQNNNAQGEYYLTDIVAQAVADGYSPRKASKPKKAAAGAGSAA